jgi:feruloyl-CoA synthase
VAAEGSHRKSRGSRPPHVPFPDLAAAGEVTDKGYINQRRVLARRAALVEMLSADPVPAAVVVAEGTSGQVTTPSSS